MKMRRTAVGVLAAIVAGQVLAAGFQGSLVSGSATWIMHADLEKIRETQLGRYALGKLNNGDVTNKIAAFSAVFGFDPRRDISTITMYGKSNNPDQGVVIIGGAFDEARLVTLLKANQTYQSQAYGTHTIHSWIDQQKQDEGRQYGCMHQSGKVLVSRGADMLKEALDVLDKRSEGLADTDKAFGAGLRTDAPFFAASSNISRIADTQPRAVVMKKAEAGWISLAEKDGDVMMTVDITATDATAATNMQNVAQGLIAMVQIGQESNPEVTRLAQSVKVSMDGNTVCLDLSYPSSRLIALIESGKSGKAGRPAANAVSPVPEEQQ